MLPLSKWSLLRQSSFLRPRFEALYLAELRILLKGQPWWELGAVVRFFLAGEMASLLSLFAGLLFIPSLALTLGVWTGSSKTFEVLYALFWFSAR
jgi:hypothetical protein